MLVHDVACLQLVTSNLDTLDSLNTIKCERCNYRYCVA